MRNASVSRRGVLSSLGTIIVGRSSVRTVSSTGLNRYVVGTYADSSRVKRAAESVDREQSFGEKTAVSGRFSEASVAALRSDPNVRYVEQNGQAVGITQAGSPWSDDPGYQQFGADDQGISSSQSQGQTVPDAIERISADIAIEAGHTGDGVDVAIIDSGIQSDHEDLVANLGEGWAAADTACSDCVSVDASDCTERWDDTNGHGTMSAGIVGARNDDRGVVGVAPEATLHAVKVLDCNLVGSYEGIAAGLRYTADNGWDVANLSVGLAEASDLVRDAVEYAHEKGVVMVAAAGNGGQCEDCVFYPAAYDEVIAVSASDSQDTLLSRSAIGPEIELTAPGDNVRTTVRGSEYAGFLNTSAASPFVTGAVAQLLANGYEPATSRTRLKETADDIGLDAEQQGAGRVNVAAALGVENGEGTATEATDPAEDILQWLREQTGWSLS